MVQFKTQKFTFFAPRTVIFREKYRRGEVNSGYSSYSVNSGGEEVNKGVDKNKKGSSKKELPFVLVTSERLELSTH